MGRRASPPQPPPITNSPRRFQGFPLAFTWPFPYQRHSRNRHIAFLHENSTTTYLQPPLQNQLHRDPRNTCRRTTSGERWGRFAAALASNWLELVRGERGDPASVNRQAQKGRPGSFRRKVKSGRSAGRRRFPVRSRWRVIRGRLGGGFFGKAACFVLEIKGWTVDVCWAESGNGF